MHIFWNKNVKIMPASEAPDPRFLWRLGDSHPDTHVITPAYYCKSVEFISSAKCSLLPSRKKK